MKSKLLIMATISILLTGCGGGDSSTTTTANSDDNRMSKPMDASVDDLNANIMATVPTSSVPVPINAMGLDAPIPVNQRPFTGLARDRQITYQAMINREAERQGVDPTLVHAIVSQESHYNPNAASGVGAVGLMQLMPATGEEVGVPRTQRSNPQMNVRGGVAYLHKGLTFVHGKLQAVIAGYNCGYGCAQKYSQKNNFNGVPPITFASGETYHYVENVTGYYSLYKQHPELIGLGALAAPASAYHGRGRD